MDSCSRAGRRSCSVWPASTSTVVEWNASGFRSPATYRNQEWFHLLEFEYDSSVSNSARFEPQPGGCASFFPFPLGGLIELPITLPQDHTLFGLSGTDRSRHMVDQLAADQRRERHGMRARPPRPRTRATSGWPRMKHTTPALLDALVDSEAWVPLPRDLARWWRARAMAPPEQIGSIEGISFGTAAPGFVWSRRDRATGSLSELRRACLGSAVRELLVP